MISSSSSLDPLVQLARVEAFAGQGVPACLRLGPVGHRRPLGLGGRVGVDDRLVFEMPAFATLCGPQDPGPARRTTGTPRRGCARTG